VTWAVLTNFQSLRVFNAQKTEPFISLDFKLYESDFDRLWLLSKESLTSGLLVQEAGKWGALPVLIPIEKHLFAQMRLWREQLFNQIFRYNDKLGLTPEQVDEIIQKLFNRLIFIRTAEDRGIEEKGLLALLHQWKTAGAKAKLLDTLRQLFKEYDGYYDSELFDQKLHHLLDNPAIFVENEVIESMLLGLYEIPGSMANYNFNDIDADVLGAVYEQYLGHVAEVMKQRAKEAQIKMDLGASVQSYTLTAKKERRKEHGIYYTPKFITDYIVRETVGRFLQENAGFADKLHNIKILDPACGSGSFLIRAYDELLRYHAQELKKPLDKLDQWERLPILTNNIFGIDLDKQAVEVARLNLLLRSLAKREPLPYLGNNIKNGNSLISGTEEELKKYFGDSWKEKNAFNWQDEFKDIMKNGGFDVVIGNPPYIQLSAEENLPAGLKEYLLDTYKSSMGRLNTFGFFVKRGIELLTTGGYLGFIVPNTILTQDYYEELRKYILENCTIENIVSFDDLPFKDAVVENVVIIVKKCTDMKVQSRHQVKVSRLSEKLVFEKLGTIPQTVFSQSRKCNFNIHIGKSYTLLKNKIELKSLPLVKLVNINQAIALKHDRGTWVSKTIINENSKPLLIGGKNIGRYVVNWDQDYLLYDKSGIHSGGDETKFVKKEKIFFRRVADRLIGALDTNQFYGLHTLVVMTLKEDTPLNIRYLLALFNSKLISFYYKNVFASTKTVFSEIGARQVAQLPIKKINLSVVIDKQIHDSMVVLVDKMIELNKELYASSDYEIDRKAQLEHQIKATDEKIDNLVYDLYEITEEERKIIDPETGA
jgi:adenine-specific DNA-methyltransferase